MNITIRNFPSYTSAFFYGKLTQAIVAQGWHNFTHCLVKVSNNSQLSLVNDTGVRLSLVASGTPDPGSEDLYVWIMVDEDEDGNEEIDIEFRQCLSPEATQWI
jgi:hypothetical protein